MVDRELRQAGDFLNQCELGHPLDESQAEPVRDADGQVVAVRVQCWLCETFFSFRQEQETEGRRWRLEEVSRGLSSETCATRQMRAAMTAARRREKFHAHWQRMASKWG
jgi:hypothetical protein